MQHENLQKLIDDKKDVTTPERLEEPRTEQQAVDERVERKILAAIENQAQPRRQLSRLTHLKAATVDAAVKSLSGRGIVKMVTVQNSTGSKPTVYVSLAREINSPEACARRLAVLGKKGLLYPV
jgi:DNA-binding MarR family transcriptional regulator